MVESRYLRLYRCGINSVHEMLFRENLLRSNNDVAEHFYVSDYTDSFEQTAKNFYGEHIKLEAKHIW